MPDYYGLPTGTLDNGFLRLEYLATAGPRIVRLFLPGSPENLLAEVPGWFWETPLGRFFPYGGHRLWHAPEAMPRTYVPDNDGLTVEPLPDGVRLLHPADPVTGVAKSVDLCLAPGRPALSLHHTLRNDGPWPVELAPWAITQLPLGGVAVLPQPTGDTGLLPNRCLVLWPYSHWGDERLHLGDGVIRIVARPLAEPFKLGYLSEAGWLAYLRAGILFCKRFALSADSPYPDRNCNVEVYCNDRVIELETLAPLVRLEPGQSTEHVEEWEVYGDPQQAPAGMREAVECVMRDV